MTRLLALVLLATVLAMTPTAPSYAADATVTLDGVTVHLREGTRQVVTVNRTTGYKARVVFWQKRAGDWHRKFRAADGRIGYNGLVPARRRVQGSGKTPLGTFRMPWAFGMGKQQDRWDPSYRRARPGDYWVLDNQSRFYNRFRNKNAGGFRWWLGSSHPDASERLRSYPQQYRWAFTTSFNAGQVRHRGGAIFLHVNGSGATAGCASAPRWFIRRLMVHVEQDQVPLVAIGR